MSVTAPTVRNLITDYQDVIAAAVRRCGAVPGDAAGTPGFAPGFDLPELTPAVRDFYAAATVRWAPLGAYGGHRLHLLDLTGNPGTRTTKTFASLVIVARAVEHIRRTGARLRIVTPTSANKGVALRDAVARAYAAGLVTPEQLAIVVLAPRATRHKFRHDALAADPVARRLNPLLRYTGDDPEGVKALGRAFVDAYAARLHDEHGVTLWYTLDLKNYLVADAARAAFEAEVAPTGGGLARWHAHAVSSAFGLLGYNLGRDVLEAAGRADPDDRPGFLLVQHLGTPDMVLSLRHGSFARDNVPTWTRDESLDAWTQDKDPRFPAVTDDPAEVLDPTFYTHRPVTSPAMNALIDRHGGDGIVVSRRECVERYPAARARLADAGLVLPAEPGRLREWSIVMALTGVCNAVDRGLVPAGHDIVVHGTGSYADDFTVADADAEVSTVADVAAAVVGRR
ncbi:DUF6002 family protein [Micromonospora sp. DT227]|uniref:DUF6002 family protein n=1 Tax=Micromonospora sp. DT227 TaxID=3393433 RepID=UPI003CE714DB